MAIAQEFLEQLKDRNDIESVVSSYVNLKRAGRNLVGLCPFHNEKSPSMVVYNDTQSFYCFGCGAGGDVITFIKKIENLDYIESVRLLAARAGLQVPEEERDDRTARLKKRIYEINREAGRFFHAQLMSEKNKHALAYLTGRGLSVRTIRRFGLGYAPDSWDALTRHLRGKGYSDEELYAAAVVGRGRSGSVYDQFRDRVMFPIIDLRGNVIAFGGRVMQGGGPKYLNSPDTPVFKKSRNLFALNFAKQSAEPYLILAEGYMDVIALHQAGFTTAVATLGTALTSEQARLVAGYVSRVMIAYDSDEAGQKATRRAIGIFSDTGVEVKVLQIEGAKDPDEYIKTFGATRFKLLLAGSAGAVEFELARARSKADVSTEQGKVAFLRAAAAVLSEIRDPIERDVYTAKLAEELSISKEAIALSVQNILKKKVKDLKRKQSRELRLSVSGVDKLNPEKAQHMRATASEEKLIALLFKNPDYLDDLLEKIHPDDFVTAFNRGLFEKVCDLIQTGLLPSLSLLAGTLTDEEMARLSAILAGSEQMTFTKQQAFDYIAVIFDEKRKVTANDIAGMDDSRLQDFIEDLRRKKK